MTSLKRSATRTILIHRLSEPLTALDLCETLDHQMEVLLCGPPSLGVGCGVLELNPTESRQTLILRLESGRVAAFASPIPRTASIGADIRVAAIIHCLSEPLTALDLCEKLGH